MLYKYTAEEDAFILSRTISNMLSFNKAMLIKFVSGVGFLTLSQWQKKQLLEAGLVARATQRRWKPTPALLEALGYSHKVTKMDGIMPHVGYSTIPQVGHPVPVPSQGLSDKEEVGER